MHAGQGRVLQGQAAQAWVWGSQLLSMKEYRSAVRCFLSQAHSLCLLGVTLPPEHAKANLDTLASLTRHLLQGCWGTQWGEWEVTLVVASNLHSHK